MSRRFAVDTEVSVDQSIAEIKKTTRQYGGVGFMHIERETEAVIAFETRDRRVMFRLPLPDKLDRKFTHTPERGTLRSDEARDKVWEQECRSRFRALALVIKAKLEAVASGIVTFDDEFLAHIVMPGGATVGDKLRPNLGVALASGSLPPLLPPPGGRS